MKKILFIDDDVMMLAAWRRYFGHFCKGAEVICVRCTSVDEAMASVAEHNAVVIFLDHSLSYDGAERLEKIRQAVEAEMAGGGKGV